jgi:hypothetical protein
MYMKLVYYFVGRRVGMSILLAYSTEVNNEQYIFN